MNFFFQCERTAIHHVMLVCYAIILMINNTWPVVDSFSVVSFLWNGNWNAQKYMAPQKWLNNFMQPPIIGCTKRYDPQPICNSPPPSNKWPVPYNHAVDLLLKRFGSKQVIISKHLAMLMQLPKLNNSSDLKQLRQLLDKTEAAIRSLQGIGVSSETYGTFLTPVIIAKIPQELRLILSRGMTNRT